MYYLQDVDIRFADVRDEQPPLMNKLSLSPYFRFNQSDIGKFRQELLLLIRKLVTLYSRRNEVNLLTQLDEEETQSGTVAANGAMTAGCNNNREEILAGTENTVQEEVAVSLFRDEENAVLVTQTDEEHLITDKEIAEAVNVALHDEVAGAIDDKVAAAVHESVPAASCKEVITVGPMSDSVIRSMKESFYKIYCEHFETAKEGGTSVMTRATYDEKVQLLIDANSEWYKGKSKPNDMQNAISRFILIGQVKGSQLYRRTKGCPMKVPYLEILFDIIHEAHLFLAHAKDCRVTKVHIDGHWWGIPENAVKVYRNLCPQCLRHSRPPAVESLQPLRMMISDTIGSRCQMDLIDYTRRPDMTKDGVFTWILRYVDHFSGFSHVAALKDKSSKSVGNALMRILSTAVLPEILQSDNGKEFLGYCINIIKEEFHTIKVVKGRAYHPASQGSVERGNATFKEALDKWLDEEDKKKEGMKKKSWSEVGIYVVNAKINNRPSRSKDKKSPYEIYYGKKSYGAPSYILDNNLLSHAKSEYAVLVVLQLMDDIGKVSTALEVEVDLLKKVIAEADDVFELSETMTREDEEGYDVDEELQKVVDKYRKEVLDRAKVTVSKGTSTPKTPETIGKSTRSNRKSTNDSPGRGRNRQGVKEAKIKQANYVNDLRARKGSGKIKTPLEKDDICTISIPKTIKSTVKNLPVMVTDLVYKRDGVRYKVCSKHGHLTGTYSRLEVAYRKNYTKEIVKIDPSMEDFKNKLSLQQACHEFGNVTGCNCVTDCSMASRCSCKVAGIPCTTLCHKGRGKNKLCTLFADLCCSEEEEDEEKEEDSSQVEATQVESTQQELTPV